MAGPGPTDGVELVRIGAAGLDGALRLPARAQALLLFAYGSGSGSGRLSPRNNHVAAALRPAGCGSCLAPRICSKSPARWMP